MYKFISAPWVYVERQLDQTAMYRTVTLALSALALIAIAFGFMGLIPFTGLELLVSLAVAVVVAIIVNVACSHIWNAHVNNESAIITALILFFLVIPAQLADWTDQWLIATIVTLAILSKFIFAWHKQHIANPAAVGVVLMGLFYIAFPDAGYYESSWWLGRPEFFIPLLIAGSLVVMKIRKWTPVLTFIAVGFVVFLFEEWKFGSDVLARAPEYFLSGPSLFLAFFMLTEPFTMPPTKKLQAGYGALVGVLSQTTLLVPFFKMTPELALVIGNIIFYPSTLKQKLMLPLRECRKIADQTYELIFTKPKSLTFKAGQYLEWMLPHEQVDARGIRRYFTIASSPTEEVLRLGLKFATPSSTYKTALHDMVPGEELIASQLAGDFTLPKDASKKLTFIAGGIGVTPFRSHIKYLIDTNDTRAVQLYYCNNTVAEIAYKDFFDSASAQGQLDLVYVVSKEEAGEGFEHGYVDEAMIRRRTPDFIERTWYLSGPPGMVNAYSTLLKKMNVPESQVVRDFFPGLA